MTGGSQNIYSRNAAIRSNVELEVTVTTEAPRAGNLRELGSWSIDGSSFLLHWGCGINRLKQGKERDDGNAALSK
jgi:hypothetical protein